MLNKQACSRRCASRCTQVFITWLRDSTTAPEILKSAAHAMKHSEARQASSTYDQEADDRLVRASYEFNLSFAAQYSAAALSGEGSSSAHVGSLPDHSSLPPLPPLPDGPLSDEQIAARLALLHCEWEDEEQTKLKGTADTDDVAVHELLDAMGADVCTLTLPDRIYNFKRSEYGAHTLNCSSHVPGMEEHIDSYNEWMPLEGGPWTAKLMRPSRQPVAHAAYRNYYLPISFDPGTTLLCPGGTIHIPIVAGAPPDGLTLPLPNSWTGTTRQLVFRLKLSKDGATASEVKINQILYRDPVAAALTEDEAEEEREEEEEAGNEDTVHVQSATVVPLAAVQASALEVVTSSSPPRQPSAGSVSDAGVDAIQAAVRSSHLELNLGMPNAGDGTMAARARAVLIQSTAPLPGEGEATAELPIAGGVAPASATAMGMAAPIIASGEVGAGDEDVDAMAVASNEQPPEQQPVSSLAPSPRQPVSSLAPSPRPAPPPVPERASNRASRKRVRFGESGELDGAASSFRSAPMARKVSVSPTAEIDVPAYVEPGETILAMGLHAGIRKRFKAVVIKIRKQFPRIVVKYVADEGGGTHPLQLPDPVTAYLTSSDVEPGTLIMA
jgi:hypothetical protein